MQIDNIGATRIIKETVVQTREQLKLIDLIAYFQCVKLCTSSGDIDLIVELSR